MAVRRKDARRRRLVIDPTTQQGDVENVVSKSPAASARPDQSATNETRAYTFGADRRNQRKTTDLIPKRLVSCLLVISGLLVSIWLINYTALNAQQWSGALGQAGLDAFAIRGSGSLSSWFLSFLLIMTGLVSLQIYALRKHRCDDYRGTYRIWVWTAGLLVLASINCVTDLGTVGTNLVRSLAGGSYVLRPWVPLALKMGVIALLMGRGVYEVRQSRGSLALIAFVWIAYSAAVIMQLPAVLNSLEGVGTETIIGNCVLFGTTALFLAHLTYARYIFLDAHGLIVQRERKLKQPKAKAKAKAKVKTKPKTKAKPKATTNSTKTKAQPKKAGSTKSNSAARAPADTTTESSTTTKSRRKPKSKKGTKSKPADNAQVASKQSDNDKSPSDVLKELAAASRQKEQKRQVAQSESSAGANRRSKFVDDDVHEDVIPMSKSQRRKRRKMDKQRRRAA